jgi:hypothetical protein
VRPDQGKEYIPFLDPVFRGKLEGEELFPASLPEKGIQKVEKFNLSKPLHFMFKRIATASLLVPAMVASVAVLPVLADTTDNDVNVSNTNSASISNTVVVGASTGSNTSTGAEGGNGGAGGSATGDDDNTGGQGGNGGIGGDGGNITTGDATVAVGIANAVNTNRTNVERVRGNDDDVEDNDVNVSNSNDVDLDNVVVAAANTDGSSSSGAAGGTGGDGGTASGDDNNAGGRGGHGGDGGWGGEISSGHSTVEVAIVNILNRNVLRVQR